MIFSKRHRYRPARESLQVESIDQAARTRLWSAYNDLVFQRYDSNASNYLESRRVRGSNLGRFVVEAWKEVLGQPTDTVPENINEAIGRLRDNHFNASWHTVYDLLEVLADNLPREVTQEIFTFFINQCLETEAAAYRLAGGHVVPLTDSQQLEAIDAAITQAPSPVATHLKNALHHLSNRKQPDFRNSIKESISAVESAVQLLEGDEKASLGQLLKHMGLHKALEKGLSSIYGYTSDADGIRHGMLDEPHLTSADAIFFLTLCSAFINYAGAKIR